MAMATLVLPLALSTLKSRGVANFGFCLSERRIHSSCLRRPFGRRCRALLPSRRGIKAMSISADTRTLSRDSKSEGAPSVLTFQQAIQRLQEYWASVGCAVMQCSNTEVGAGTMNPLTFLRVLGPEPWNVAYVEPSIRPDDSRYGDNPNRLQRHTQFQVILKPDPGNSQDLFLHSLSALGININDHDIRFVEDNWESPVLGAWGLGWEVWMDGMEITQFTYFQQSGSLPLLPVSVEITYGLERILMLLQGVDHFKKIMYTDGITYGELFLENEKEMSAYYLEHASVDHIHKLFDSFEREAHSLLELGLAIPAYDQVLKTSHAFNILDSRGFVGVTERARYFSRMRSLARQCAQLWVKTRESLGHPLGIVSGADEILFPKNILDSELRKVTEDPRAFVLEIGTEEMPPHDVTDAGQQMKSLIIETLAKRRIKHGEILACGTPRRLVIFVDQLNSKQTEIQTEVRGPPASKAFDQNGAPTKAAEGFCRRYNVPLDSLYKKVDGKMEYIYAQVKESARFSLEVLAEDLPEIIGKISFPKSMRWNSQVMFSRPIRWILALHGNVVIPFSFAGVQSGKMTCGLRNSKSATIEIEDAESYLGCIERTGILTKIEDRKHKIVQFSNSLVDSVGGKLVYDDSLLDEVSNLIESPVPILGHFDESFLDLPEEILIMVMRKHQKYFPVRDKLTNKLLPFFISVANGAVDVKVVKKGNEAVLRARYEDAKFFYHSDTQKSLSEFRQRLSGILFHEKLGTMLDKTNRIQQTVSKLTFALNLDESILSVVEEAGALAMSDLATSIVTEFTSLAGTMARHYAFREGSSQQVAEAIYEITLPRFSGDAVPKTDAGIVLSMADRLDSLVGLFGVGCQPTSTNDPFGLRRISYGLVQILVENKKNIDLRHALKLAADVQPVNIDSNTLNDVHQFVTRRLEQFLVDKGISPEIVRSVLLERGNCPCLASESVHEMDSLSKGDVLPKIVEAYSRPTRIIRGKDVGASLEVDSSAFETDEERALWNAFLAVKGKVHQGVDVHTFVEASSELVQPLENFFNKVFVMVEDERVRKNRFALLKNIAELPKGIVDLSVLPGF
ncbi:glycine-tRNA ligase [Wolffia australiana]